jgi:phosphomannomutase
VNTVESDLNAARAAKALGYEPVLTGVGDKWVLKRAADDPDRYGIGSEETGHNISRGWIRTRAGKEETVFLGNGLKSAVNTFAATRGMSPREAHRPFPPGFKKTMYVYYTNKALLAAGSEVFEGVAKMLEDACGIAPVERRPLPEEPDMLYLMVGDQRAGVFVRNSGTEEKTGVNVRGAREDSAALVEMAEEAVLYLARTMKDHGHPMARAERAVLEALSRGPLPESALPVPGEVHRERLLQEMANKEKVIRLGADGTYERTELGTRMLEAWS